jgi:hypothetical protein
MGDMADWVNDNGEIENLLYGPGGSIACRYCGTSGLHWENIGTKLHPIWRLFDDQCVIHSCLNKKTTENIK